jgi:enamine deaminase RidA (YjgF/YER057c/UK114 family)
MTRRISTGSPFEAQIGYSRAVVCDGWVFVAGTTGYDYASMTMPADVTEQCRNALATIRHALAEAGAGFDDVVRVRYILTDPADWPPCWPIVRTAFAAARPAATMLVAGLQAPEMKIEVEVTARLPALLLQIGFASAIRRFRAGARRTAGALPGALPGAPVIPRRNDFDSLHPRRLPPRLPARPPILSFPKGQDWWSGGEAGREAANGHSQ